MYLLDTNILVALVRAGRLGEYVENKYRLLSQSFKPLISAISVGEILKLTKRFGWGDAKIATLQTLLDSLVKIGINRPQILEAYAEIAYSCEKSGNIKPHNDYWIAATAKASGATLLTTDKHFDDLHKEFIDRIWIDETLGKE